MPLGAGGEPSAAPTATGTAPHFCPRCWRPTVSAVWVAVGWFWVFFFCVATVCQCLATLFLHSCTCWHRSFSTLSSNRNLCCSAIPLGFCIEPTAVGVHFAVLHIISATLLKSGHSFRLQLPYRHSTPKVSEGLIKQPLLRCAESPQCWGAPNHMVGEGQAGAPRSAAVGSSRI